MPCKESKIRVYFGRKLNRCGEFVYPIGDEAYGETTG